jgi:hypothetical protein
MCRESGSTHFTSKYCRQYQVFNHIYEWADLCHPHTPSWFAQGQRYLLSKHAVLCSRIKLTLQFYPVCCPFLFKGRCPAPSSYWRFITNTGILFYLAADASFFLSARITSTWLLDVVRVWGPKEDTSRAFLDLVLDEVDGSAWYTWLLIPGEGNPRAHLIGIWEFTEPSVTFWKSEKCPCWFSNRVLFKTPLQKLTRSKCCHFITCQELTAVRCISLCHAFSVIH